MMQRVLGCYLRLIGEFKVAEAGHKFISLKVANGVSYAFFGPFDLLADAAEAMVALLLEEGPKCEAFVLTETVDGHQSLLVFGYRLGNTMEVENAFSVWDNRTSL